LGMFRLLAQDFINTADQGNDKIVGRHVNLHA
jgi:hypothetical protein